MTLAGIYCSLCERRDITTVHIVCAECARRVESENADLRAQLSAALRRERKLRRAVLAWAGHAWVLSGASGKDACGIRLMARARDGSHDDQ